MNPHNPSGHRGWETVASGQKSCDLDLDSIGMGKCPDGGYSAILSE